MCGVGGVGQGPQHVPGQVGGVSGPAKEPGAPTQVGGASGGGGLGSDVLAQLMEAVRGLETLVGGLSGGGPSGAPVQQGTAQPVQQGGPQQQGQVHGKHGGKHGKHGGKPGWGNGGSGPPGLMRRMPAAQHEMPAQRETTQAERPRPSAPATPPRDTQVGQASEQVPSAPSAPSAPADSSPSIAPPPTLVTGTEVDPKSLREVPAPEGAPTTDKSGAKIRYFVHPGDETPRPMSEAMIRHFGIDAP